MKNVTLVAALLHRDGYNSHEDLVADARYLCTVAGDDPDVPVFQKPPPCPTPNR
jgi:hypothetical protein